MHAALLVETVRGQRLRDNLHVVIVGPPNVGKSSLLNALAGNDRAIVTAVPGTTRDLLRESVQLNGIELTLVDTAGLRDSGDAIEREGMRRARVELASADLALAVVDATEPELAKARPPGRRTGRPRQHVLWLHNKADLLEAALARAVQEDCLWMSARSGLRTRRPARAAERRGRSGR